MINMKTKFNKTMTIVMIDEKERNTSRVPPHLETRFQVPEGMLWLANHGEWGVGGTF